MTVNAKAFFDQTYGGRDTRRSASVRIETEAGPREVVLDPPNLRVKALGLSTAELGDPVLRGLIQGLSDEDLPYSKFTVYAQPGEELAWVARGFLKEGEIHGFFADGTDAHLWALYGDDERNDALRDAAHDRIVMIAAEKEPARITPPEDLACRVAGLADAPAVAALLSETFTDYPTPLDEETVAGSIADGTHHFRLLCDADGDIVAAASAEIDRRRASAEMTDCATRPDYRGRGLMSYLLRELERDMAREYGIRDLYTLARADEVGMNCAFAKLGYVYTGRLVNNCRMPNGWESMNVWCLRTGAADEAEN